jgi:hypothetical protein
MARLEKETAPVEVIGVMIKRSEIQEAVGLGINREIVGLAEKIISEGIRNEAGQRTCAEIILRMKIRMDEIKGWKDKIVKKIKAAVKDAEEPFNNAYNEIAALKIKLNSAYTEYDDRERARKESEERQRRQDEADRMAAEQAANHAQDRENEEADLLAPADQPASKPTPPAPARPPVDVSIRSNPARVAGVGTLSVIRTWKVRVLNPALIPEAYKVPSENKLMEAFNAGIRSIPGCEFYEETSTRSLTKGR